MNSYIKLAAVFIVFFVFFGFLGIKISGLLAKPSIEIYQPKNLNLSGGDVAIKGGASRVNFLAINGRPVLLSKDGFFETDLLLPKGFNMIELKSTDGHGKIYSRRIMIAVQN